MKYIMPGSYIISIFEIILSEMAKEEKKLPEIGQNSVNLPDIFNFFFIKQLYHPHPTL